MNFDDRKARLVLGLRRAGVTDRDVMAAIMMVRRVDFFTAVLLFWFSEKVKFCSKNVSSFRR